MKQSPTPRRRTPLQARKPMDRDVPMLGCGTGYPTEAAARRSKRGQAEGAEFGLCLLRECGRWHVRLPGKPRAGLAAGRDTGPDDATRAAVYKRDGGKCVCCGTPLAGRPRSVGHRVRRCQLGGNDRSNLLSFLGHGINQFDPDDHHARIDSRRNPSDAKRGYSLRSWQDPRAEAVLVVHGPGRQAWKRLADDAPHYRDAPAGEQAA